MGGPVEEDGLDKARLQLLSHIMRMAQCDAATAIDLLNNMEVEKPKKEKRRRRRGAPEFLEWMQHGLYAKVLRPPVTTDDRIGFYSAMADDTAIANKKREAAILFSSAEASIGDSNHTEALKNAKAALEAFRAVSDAKGEADAIRLLAQAYRCKSEMARWNPAEFGGEGTAVEAEKEAEELVKRELGRYQRGGDGRGQGSMELALAEMDLDEGAPAQEAAIEGAQRARQLFKDAGDPKMEALAVLTLSRLLGRRHRDQEAQDAATLAGTLFEAISDSKGQLDALHARAIACEGCHENASAVQFARKAVEMARQLGDQRQVAFELTALGYILLSTERENEALPAAEEALDIFKEKGTPYGFAAVAEQVLVLAHIGRGAEEKAVDAAIQGVERSQGASDQREEILAQATLAFAYMHSEDFDEADLAIKAAITACQDLADKEWESKVLILAGTLHRDQQLMVDAERELQDAEAYFTEHGDSEQEAVAALILSSLLSMKGESDKALQEAEKGRDLFRKEDNKDQEQAAVLLLAGAFASQGQLEKAMDAAMEAQQMAKEANYKKGEAMALSVQCELHKDLGDVAEAMKSAMAMKKASQEAKSYTHEIAAWQHITTLHMERKESKLAVKAAETALRVCQKAGNRADEVWMLCLTIDARVALIADVGAEQRTVSDAMGKLNQHLQDARVKAQKTGRSRLQALVNLHEANVMYVLGRYSETVASAEMARRQYAQLKDRRSEGFACMMVAKGNNEMDGGKAVAASAAEEAVEIFKELGDEESLALAQALVDHITPKQYILADPSMMPAGQMDFAAGAAPAAASSVAEQKPKGLDPEMVSETVRSMAIAAIGLDDEVYLDSPLMDSGMDSLTAVSFRNGLQQNLGVKLPSSLMFDYPTMKEVSNRIVELSLEQ